MARKSSEGRLAWLLLHDFGTERLPPRTCPSRKAPIPFYTHPFHVRIAMLPPNLALAKESGASPIHELGPV